MESIRKGTDMIEPCLCGADDCRRCFPYQAKQPEKEDFENALEVVLETIMDYGQYPANGPVVFDLYDYLHEERDPSYAMEMYVASMSSNKWSFEERIERERKAVESMLMEHLKHSDIVAELAEEYANE